MAKVTVALVAVLTGITACGPGQLPPLPRPPDSFDSRDSAYVRDWFPTDSSEPFPLDRAIRMDRLDEVRQLLEQGANPNRRWGQSGDHFPLQEVLDSGGGGVSDPIEAVRLLLDHGADPNARWCPFESRGGYPAMSSCRSAQAATPLIFAAMAGSVEIVELLLRAGADPSRRDWLNGAALDYAYNEVMFEMISRALFPDLRTRDQETLSWLRKSEAYLAPWNSTPLSRAISLDRIGYVPPPPHVDGGPYRAANERQLARVRTLIRIGADPNERATPDGGDWTPLGLALQQGAVRTARSLLQSGADPNQRWCVGYSFVLFKRQTRDSASLDPACTSTNGMTPLMWSASKGAAEAIALLLEFNADRSLTDWAGRTAMDYATTADIRQLLSAS